MCRITINIAWPEQNPFLDSSDGNTCQDAIYEKLMLDREYISWLDRQATKTKEKVRMCICNVIYVRNSNMDIYQYIRNIFCASPHSLCLSYMYTDTQGHRYEVRICH